MREQEFPSNSAQRGSTDLRSVTGRRRSKPPAGTPRAVLGAVGLFALVLFVAVCASGGSKPDSLPAGLARTERTSIASARTISTSSRLASARVWIVRPGDTLWGIALASGAKGDIRPYVDRLSSEVGGRPLQVGERIVLPPRAG